MRAQEQSQPEEKRRIPPISEVTPSLLITEADMSRVSLERVKMLASIDRYLSAAEREAIQEKLEKERKLMLGMIETEKKFQTAPKQSFLVLDKIYFKHKTIDNNAFE